MDYLLVIISLCVFMGYTIEIMTGFGGVLIALLLATLFVPFNDAFGYVLASSVLMTSYMMSRYYKDIDTYLLFKVIAPWMLIGGVLGALLQPYLSPGPMLFIFSVLILGVSIYNLYPPKSSEPPPLTSANKFYIFIAGIVQGAFASGGPMLVAGLANVSINKTQFRATMISVWWMTNSLLLINLIASQGVNSTELKEVGLIALTLPLAYKLGIYGHQLINENRFKHSIFQLLAVISIAKILKQTVDYFS